MPQYMLLIYNPVEGGPTPEEMAAQHQRWMSYTEDLNTAGLLVGGEALRGVDVATTVRVRGAQTQVTDGPFAETKEFLAGYYLIDAADLDTALSWAGRMPNIEYGSVEVRPVWDVSGSASEAEAVQTAAGSQ
jgi:hypothetical protein